MLWYYHFLKQTKMDYQEVLGLSLDISSAKKKRERARLLFFRMTITGSNIEEAV